MSDQQEATNEVQSENNVFSSTYALIKNGSLLDAEVELKKIIESNTHSSPSNETLLEAYSHLIRIASTTQSFDKIKNYLDTVKSIEANTDSEKQKFAWCLQATGASWLYFDNIDKAKECFLDSLKIATEIDDENLQLTIEYSLVWILRFEGKYDSALNKLDELQSRAEKVENKNHLIQADILRGDVFRKKGHYQKALEFLTSTCDEVKDKNSVHYHHILWSMGTCYAALEEKEKAKVYLNLATNDFKGVEFWRINILSKLTLAKLHATFGDYDLAKKLYEEIQTAIGDDEGSYFGRRLLGAKVQLFVQMAEFSNANECIDRLVVISAKENNLRELMRLRIWKGRILLRGGDASAHEKARAMLLEACAYYKERKDLKHQAQCLELLARLDSRSGHPKDSLKKIKETIDIAETGAHEKLFIRASLAKLVLHRKLGESTDSAVFSALLTRIRSVNAQAERIILDRFSIESYDEWQSGLQGVSPLSQVYVNDFFEDFHFIPNQKVDLEIDKNSSYVREKHLGEIPFHNKFTLMRLLCLLAESPGKEYSKEELAQKIWNQEYNPLRHDNNIYININRLRKLVEPNPRESRYIMNGSNGYYFNPSMKVNIASRISNVAPRTVAPSKPLASS